DARPHMYVRTKNGSNSYEYVRTNCQAEHVIPQHSDQVRILMQITVFKDLPRRLPYTRGSFCRWHRQEPTACQYRAALGRRTRSGTCSHQPSHKPTNTRCVLEMNPGLFFAT